MLEQFPVNNSHCFTSFAVRCMPPATNETISLLAVSLCLWTDVLELLEAF